MGNVIIETDETDEQAEQDGQSSTGSSDLSRSARELARRARDFVADNPFAALGIAVGTGFLVGRAMRMWALRP